jgi:hypothetical protein
MQWEVPCIAHLLSSLPLLAKNISASFWVASYTYTLVSNFRTSFILASYTYTPIFTIKAKSGVRCHTFSFRFTTVQSRYADGRRPSGQLQKAVGPG